MINAKIEKASNGNGYDVKLTAIGKPIELAREVTYLVLRIHKNMARTSGKWVYRHMIQLMLAEGSGLWTEEPDDE